MNFKLLLAEKLAEKLDVPNDELYDMIEIPPNTEMGDFAFPCFRLAKLMKKPPAAIAAELAGSFDAPGFIKSVAAAGPYLNFFLDKVIFAETVLREACEKGDGYGRSDVGAGKTVVIDYSSPNIAKPFHVGHLRSTVIGNALYNIYELLGYNCVGINHLGDWGTQFGKLITAYKKWGVREELEKTGIGGFTELYVRFHDEAEKNPQLDDEARAWFVKMQEGDEEALSLWKWIYDISITEFNRVYDRLGIKFDALTGESFYNDKMDAVIDELKRKELLVESKGAMIVDLEEYNLPPCLIIRTDGGTLYATRDLAAAIYRNNNYNFSKCLYLTALDQSLHFAQFFKVLDLMGYEFAKDLEHVPFGLVSLEDGKLSTRRGNVVLMEELLSEAVRKTADIIEERNPDLEDKHTTAEIVGIGAVIFNDLYNGRIKDVVFSWERMLNFNGETGPYVQYTHTRANSVLKKAAEMGIAENSDIDYSKLTDETSQLIIKQLYYLPEKVLESAGKNEPSVIARHLVDLCQSFNKLYNEAPILRAEQKTRDARLMLTRQVKCVIKNMLSVLGIRAPEKM